jgi:hypothetical protein
MNSRHDDTKGFFKLPGLRMALLGTSLAIAVFMFSPLVFPATASDGTSWHCIVSTCLMCLNPFFIAIDVLRG